MNYIDYDYEGYEPEYEACTRCGQPCDADPHHKVKQSCGGTDEDTVQLCRECHEFVEQNPDLAEMEGYHIRKYKIKGEVYGGEEEY